MKYHLATQTGQWVGGFQVQRAQLAAQVEELRDIATMYAQPLIATRLDKVRRGEQIVILPR